MYWRFFTARPRALVTQARAVRAAAAGLALSAAVLCFALLPSGPARGQSDAVAPSAPGTAQGAYTDLGSPRQDKALRAAAALQATAQADALVTRTAALTYHQRHLAHLAHLAHMARLHAAASSVQAPVTVLAKTRYQCGDGDGDGYDMPCSQLRPATPAHAAPVTVSHPGGGSASGTGCSDPSGHLTAAQVEMAWNCAGGPHWADSAAVGIATCESGMNTRAFNPSGATGLFQILGAVVPGDLYDAHVNALNAVSKFDASGQSWAQWVCRP
jgi:hypothetical protein